MTPRKLNLGKYLSFRVAGAAPVLMMMIFALVYFYSQKMFIQCESPSLVTCNPIKPENLISLEKTLGSESSPGVWNARLDQVYTARLRWVFLTVANFLLQGISVVVFGIVLMHWYRGYLVGLLILGSFLIGLPLAFVDPLPLAKPLLEVTVAARPEGIANIVNLFRFSTGISLGFAILFATSLGGLLFHKENEQNGLVDLVEKRRHLSILMYFAAVLLMFGVLRGNADFGFVSAFLDLSDNSVHHEFFGSVTAILGGFYTLFLGGVYLPTALIIQKRAERLVVPMPGTGETTENLLSSYGFTFSIRDAVPKVLALAGPILTGVSTEMLNRL